MAPAITERGSAKGKNSPRVYLYERGRYDWFTSGRMVQTVLGYCQRFDTEALLISLLRSVRKSNPYFLQTFKDAFGN